MFVFMQSHFSSTWNIKCNLCTCNYCIQDESQHHLWNIKNTASVDNKTTTLFDTTGNLYHLQQQQQQQPRTTTNNRTPTNYNKNKKPTPRHEPHTSNPCIVVKQHQFVLALSRSEIFNLNHPGFHGESPNPSMKNYDVVEIIPYGSWLTETENGFMEPKYSAEDVIGHPNHQLKIWRLMPRDCNILLNNSMETLIFQLAKNTESSVTNQLQYPWGPEGQSAYDVIRLYIYP